MLLEGALAVLVILACCAGLGMGIEREGTLFSGAAAWSQYYGGNWADMGLAQKVGAFVEGGANMIAALGLPLDIAVGIIAVMVACFAATTLDTATRLQRYVLQELGGALRVTPLTNKYVATAVAVVCAGAMALIAGPKGPGSGGLILWPLFGAINQLLAGLAFLVVAFYLIRHNRPVHFLVVPLCLMVVLPAWAMTLQIIGFYQDGNYLLVGLGTLVEILQVWMIVEGIIMWKKARGVAPEPLPPLRLAPESEGGRSC
jgi:carbon starvation protein